MMENVKSLFAALLVLIITLLCCCYMTKANTTAENMIVYFINTDIFNKFLEDPSKDMLKNNPEVECAMYSISNENAGYIKKEIPGCKPSQIQEEKGGWYMSFGGLPVYDTLIDFVGSKERVNAYISKNGVAEEANNIALFCCEFPGAVKVPPTLWVETTQKDYYITIAIKIDEENYQNGGEYVYSMYTAEEYKNKFGIKDATLYVNGEDISQGNYVKMQNGGAYMPLRAIMEGLGFGVEWNDTDRTIHITCGEQKYILHTQNQLSLYEEGSEHDLLIPPPGSFNAFTYTIINDRIIMDDYTMRTLLSLVGVQMSIDFDLTMISITR